MLQLEIHALFDGFCELLYLLNFFLVLLCNLLDYLEGPVAFTEDFEHFFSVAGSVFSFDFHTVVCSLGAFDMEEDLTFGLVAFDTCANVDSSLATDDTAVGEPGVVHFVHLDWGLGSYNRSRHP